MPPGAANASCAGSTRAIHTYIRASFVATRTLADDVYQHTLIRRSGRLGAQSDLIGAPEPMSIEAVLAAPIGGSACVLPNISITQHFVMPSIGVARGQPATRCGVTGLEIAVGRGARRCCEQTARLPVARSRLIWRALCGNSGRLSVMSRAATGIR
jgi:hypothetical protein